MPSRRARPVTEGDLAATFIERHCRLTRGERRGEPVRLLPFQRGILRGLLELRPDRRRKHRRAYVQMPRKNGKTYLFAALSLYEALMGEEGGEVYYVAGDRLQASRAFDEVKRIVEQDDEIASMVVPYRFHMEVPSTGTILRVLSSEVSLQMGLSPSFTLFDEVAMQPTDKLWTTMSLGSAARAQPMMVGISTPGWEKESLAYSLYTHGKKVQSGELEDPGFYFTAFEPGDPDCDHTDPKVWRECNPALDDDGGFLNEEDFVASLSTTPESEFRRFRLGQWTATRNAALPSGAWSSCYRERRVREGEPIVVGFDGSRARDCTALVGCTLDGHLFVIDVWEPEQGRVDPRDVAEAIKQTRQRYDVRALAADETLWTWVLIELGQDVKMEVLAVPTNAPRYVALWQRFRDGVMEHKLTHDGDPRLARHVDNLVIKSDRFGQRATKELPTGRSFIDAAMAGQFAYFSAVDQNLAPQPAFNYDVG